MTKSRTGHSRARRLRALALRIAVRATAALLVLAIGSALLVSCAIRPPAVGSIDGAARLDLLDRSWHGLESEVTISWDEHLIPSITAASDADLAYAIGLVHAHLRLSQMEFFRRVSQGRLSEMAGPWAAEVDAAIRAIDLDRAVDQMQTDLPAETRLWLDRYVEGINAYRIELKRRPADARTLGFDYKEPWTVRDVLIFGRLASVDVNWGRWLSLLSLRDQQGYDEFIARVWGFGDDGLPSFGAGAPHELDLLTDIGRTGSNAMVVSGARSASGGALVASDPHLGLPQPNIWCVIGYRAPDRAAVGLTIPGLPFILVGRNEQIAWTGTNMQSTSTVLYRLEDGWQPVATRTEPIGVRWWFDQERQIRDSALGPVITDAKLLQRLGDGDIAMRWRGHEPSDEATAFKRASEADSWDGFRSAFATYAVGGQNMLYGDSRGNIGQIMAIEAIPAAAAAGRIGPVDAAEDGFAWGDGIPSDQLPAAYNPDEGYLVSANNVPAPLEPALTPQGNANDRIGRLRDLLAGDGPVTLDDLAAMQRDTYSEASHRLAQAIAELAPAADTPPEADGMLQAIAAWDGRYEADSVGAAAYQQALSALIDRLYADRYGERIVRTMRSAPYVHDFVREDLARDGGAATLRAALAEAAEDFKPDQTWGDLHRLRLAHPIGNLPVLGAPYVFEDLPHPGTTTTLYKAAHRVQSGRHNTTFGACARMLCDMGSLDDNRVVLLGGQDGWLGSDRLLDQVPLWRRGEMIPLPLSAEAQQERAITVMRLGSGGGS
ncbi:MAG: penicillin acylase family protein [Phycisphaerales bacterium JB039]